MEANQELIVSPAESAIVLKPLQTDANNLIEQANRAVIETTEHADAGVDLKKLLASQRTKMDEARKKLVKPLNDHVKMINGEFNPKINGIKQAEAVISRKVLSFKQAEDQKRREKEEAQRKATEEAAMARAAEAEEAGDTELADDIVDAAAEIPEVSTKTEVSRGGYTGAAGSIRKTWAFNIDNKIEVPEQFKTVDETAIRNFLGDNRRNFENDARTNGLKGEAVKEFVDTKIGELKIPGVSIFQKEDLNVR